MEFFDANSLADLNIDYLMALNSAVGYFYHFCEENSEDPRFIGISNHLQGMTETILNDLYLLQAFRGH